MNASPYNDLYIYYLEGKPEPGHFGSDFIGNWEEDGYAFLFFSQPADKRVDQLVRNRMDLTLIDRFCMKYEEWQGGKLSDIKIGRFLIVPPWNDAAHNSPKPGETLIVLDPGVVFGTGIHSTTRDCLEALERLCYEEKIESAADLGTGTGLLAIAAARMGCKSVLAVDFNYLAVQTARRNVMLNQLESNILVIQGRAEEFVDKTADLVIANIHYDVMKCLIDSENFLASRWFILSGLMRSQAAEVNEMLGRFPVKWMYKLDHDGIWHTFYGRID